MELSLISEKLQAGRAKEVVALVQQALDEGIPSQKILEEGLMAGMAVVGIRFKNGEAFVPEVLVAAMTRLWDFGRWLSCGDFETIKNRLEKSGAFSDDDGVILRFGN